MLAREKNYVLLMVVLLIFSIFILVISSSKDKEDYQDNLDNLENPKIFIILVGKFPEEIKEIKNTNYDIVKFNAKKDISPEDWNELANIIFKMYSKYDAFIILHNSETITYTASALSFMLENLDKTVILSTKIKSALEIAKNHKIPEVIICDNEKIIRGCRSKKIKNYITSPGYSFLGKTDGGITLEKEHILPMPKEPIKFIPIDSNKKIIVFKLFPGVNSKDLLSLTKNQSVDAVIIESYDKGFISEDIGFVKLLNELTKYGIIIVNVSQNMDNSTDKNLEETGIISGGSLTTEAALTKLYFLLSNVKADRDLIKNLMCTSLRGEN